MSDIRTLSADLPIANSYTIGQRLFKRTYIGSYEYEGTGGLTAVVLPNVVTSEWLFYVYDHVRGAAVKQVGYHTAPDAIRAATDTLEAMLGNSVAVAA